MNKHTSLSNVSECAESQPMSFLQRWAQGHFGQVEAKAINGYERPTIATYRQRFASAAADAAKQLRAGNTGEKMGWCTKSPRGFLVTLRLGVKALNCGGRRTQTIFPDAESAAAFMEAAAQAALAGELDDAIQQAQIKRKQRTQEIAG